MFHSRKIIIAFCLLGLTAVWLFPSQSEVRAQLPSNTEAADPLPITQRELLLNEMPVMVAPRPGTTSVSLVALVKVGATFDRSGKAGLAALTAESLLAGAKNRDGSPVDAAQLKQELEDNGGQLDIVTDWDATRLHLNGPARNVNAFIEILGRLVTSPSFNTDEFTRLKQARIAAAEHLARSAQADGLFSQALFGAHPYGHTVHGTAESLRQITRFDVLDFYKRHYLSNNAALIIVGEVSMPQVLSTARRSFGGWVKGKPAPYTFLPPNDIQGVKIAFYPNPELPEVQVRAGFMTAGASAADALVWKVVDKLLKQRLSGEGVVVETRHLVESPWMIRATTEPEKAVSAVENLLKLFKEMRETPLTAEKLQPVKEAVLKEYQSQTQSNAGVARVFADLECYQIGRRIYAELPQHLAALTPADVQRVLERVGGKQLMVVVQGGKADLATGLGTFGTVQVVTPPQPANDKETRKPGDKGTL